MMPLFTTINKSMGVAPISQRSGIPERGSARVSAVRPWRWAGRTRPRVRYGDRTHRLELFIYEWSDFLGFCGFWAKFADLTIPLICFPFSCFSLFFVGGWAEWTF